MNRYQQNCLTTESLNWHQPDTRLLHASMGLVTETAELLAFTDRVNFLEELGDILWYISVGTDTLQCTLVELDDLTPDLNGDEELIEMMVTDAADILDRMKKSIFYGRGLDRLTLLQKFAALLSCVELMAITVNSSLEEVMDLNIKKLQRRFPDKEFNSHHANNRDVAAEMSEF